MNAVLRTLTTPGPRAAGDVRRTPPPRAETRRSPWHPASAPKMAVRLLTECLLTESDYICEGCSGSRWGLVWSAAWGVSGEGRGASLAAAWSWGSGKLLLVYSILFGTRLGPWEGGVWGLSGDGLGTLAGYPLGSVSEVSGDTVRGSKNLDSVSRHSVSSLAVV